ncbi:hypothetical protein SAMN05216559_1457 [Halomicrobium zhouii]|uniref:DUF7344 domain-containing protein n=1 Tax=Halomicrobium zhouii TaxID=767519 RepID=A0A1I6KSF9_9EURY|nr:hypothetical protein [Halomicrobium zhouii]SFR94146.1 hypothetical protein SAMN05216559_1457 [Halomicrobium zhouii]
MSEHSADATGPASSDSFERSHATALDATFDVLSNRRRREAFRCLAAHDEPMALADLADEVAVAERGAPITDISAEVVKHVYVTLYHSHVPSLENAGFVRYDQERDLVTLTQDRPDLDRFDATAVQTDRKS